MKREKPRGCAEAARKGCSRGVMPGQRCGYHKLTGGLKITKGRSNT